MTRKFSTVVLAAALALTAAVPVLAGYRIQESDPEFPGDVTTYWFQGGKARIDGALEGLTVIIDVKGGEGLLIDAAAKRCAGGKIAAITEELKKLDEQGQDVGAKAGEEAGESGATPGKPLKIEVKDLGPGERILGYETRRHQVLVDGELLEELWIAPQLEVGREVDLAAFGIAMQKMIGGDVAVSQGYEESPAYRALRAVGYPLRQVLYFVGEKSTLEVTEVKTEALPTADFAEPKGCTKVGYVELLLGEGE